MKRVETFLEFPPESMTRPDFRRFYKYIKSFKDHKNWFKGKDGRFLIFHFENEQKKTEFLEAVEQMFKARMVGTVKKET